MVALDLVQTIIESTKYLEDGRIIVCADNKKVNQNITSNKEKAS